MPRKVDPSAFQAANEPRPQAAQNEKPKPGFDPSALRGPKGGKPKWGGSSMKKMPIPGKGWGR